MRRPTLTAWLSLLPRAVLRRQAKQAFSVAMAPENSIGRLK
jgi:hypothetical protein